ncbi:uncharacterized protein [Chelonus insularis]|uniref:uncharacterized protein n=1 Tax=Chelonus insularis TaxID=460826 RepID=UPI00158B4151|nr:uncharacterized protein LOC118069581 [Chelonus insularis]KAG8148339.1 putative envelope protein odv-e66-4 [Chelonus insularis]
MIFQLYVIISHIIIIFTFIVTFALYTQNKLNTQVNVYSEIDNGDGDYLNHETYKIKIEKIKRFLHADKTFETSTINLARDYSFDHTKIPHKDFINWETQEDIFLTLCDFGIQLLKYYTTYKTSEMKLLIVTDILKRIKIKIDDNVSKYLNKWITWHRGLSYLLKLLAIYEYVAHDNFVKHFICHDLIVKIIPKLDQLFDIKINDEKIILFAIPRLLSNFLFDPTAYENDIKSNEFKTLDKYFCIEYNLSDDIKTGLYSDGSCIKDNSVVSYLDLLPLVRKRDAFYDKMYTALGFKVNYRERVQFILKKLLHPSIKYHIVGLFGNSSNKIQIPDWWNLELLETGVHIFPFTGIGIFKRHNILFAIRLHQLSINSPVKNKFTLGLMQLRKIYQLDDNEESELSEEQIIHELGVIRIKGTDTQDIYKCIPKESYIGKLLDINLLFWINKYTLLLPYKCEVTEIGVMTNGGLVSKYQIKNNENDRSLIFVSTNTHNKKIENVINPGVTSTFSIKIILDDNETVTNVDFQSDKLMEFEYHRKKYELISLDHQNSYIVKCENKPIIGGTSSSNPFDFMIYDNQIFKRYSSFMYEPTISTHKMNE